MNRKNELYYEIIEGSVKSQNIINFLDKFSEDLTQRTVVILDQASIYTSDAIRVIAVILYQMYLTEEQLQ